MTLRNRLAALHCRISISGHKWVEREPHNMWGLNEYDCARCGAHKREGIFK